VEPERTPVSRAEIRSAIASAYQRVTGRPASAALVDTLSAQASLETGNGRSMYNFNFGGIKGSGPQGQTAHCMTHEVIGGRDVTLRQGFRAYSSLQEGAEDFLRVLTQRFGAALSKAQLGDVDGFAHMLKQAGYYTASEAQYAGALRSRNGAGAAPQELQDIPSLQGLAAGAGGASVSSGDLSRFVDALSASALRIASSSDDDD
jgi:flagellar protein FlgJ